jgi:hypothetical protein
MNKGLLCQILNILNVRPEKVRTFGDRQQIDSAHAQ